jgi:hypothetical protein
MGVGLQNASSNKMSTGAFNNYTGQTGGGLSLNAISQRRAPPPPPPVSSLSVSGIQFTNTSSYTQTVSGSSGPDVNSQLHALVRYGESRAATMQQPSMSGNLGTQLGVSSMLPNRPSGMNMPLNQTSLMSGGTQPMQIENPFAVRRPAPPVPRGGFGISTAWAQPGK